MTNTELKSIRKALDLSKTDFARAIGISPVMEGKYEKGSREIPDEVGQAAYELLNTADQEPDPVVDEEDVFEDREEAASAAYEAPAEDEISASVAYEAPAGDEISASVAYEAPAGDEISASVTEETVDPEVEDVTSPAADESAAEEVIPAADADQPAADVSASAAEETAAVAETAPAEEKENTVTVNASAEEDGADIANWGAAALPFVMPPLLITQCLLNIGFMLSPKKRSFFWPWW